MMYLATPRLVVVATPLAVIEQRLTDASFSAAVAVGDETWQVQFPEEWPGDALALFPTMANAYNADESGGSVIDRAERVAVGQIGTKGSPDAEGRVEIGYGISMAYWNRGYATEAVGGLVEYICGQPHVRVVAAETRTDNVASIRVLEKLGFTQAGERFDEEDGALFVWERVCSSVS